MSSDREFHIGRRKSITSVLGVATITVAGCVNNSSSPSPESVTESYYDSLEDHDYDNGMVYASEEAAAEYSEQEFNSFASKNPKIEEIDDVEMESDRAYVRILVSIEAVEGLVNNEVQDVTLEKQNDTWVIVDICRLHVSYTCDSGLDPYW